MNVAVAAKLEVDPAEQPPSPLPDVQPPAVFAPKPISAPASTSRPPTASPPALPENVRVSQPYPSGIAPGPAASRNTRLPPSTPTRSQPFQPSTGLRRVTRST